MSWPLSHEFNEAIQNPKVAFADPDLRDGEVVVGASGLPLPRSGNFADVYQMRGADGREWAVKCFTRPVAGLAERYAKVSEALGKANLPFAVGFKFLAEGIRIGGVWRPIVVMEWVEGLLLNQVVREAAGKPSTLSALGQMWAKLCKRLREAGLAHADLQHGNVLLVPGTRAGAYGLKLIDYDGVWVPALANTPSGESGHPSFQHPARAATRAYSPDVDRFPHLVVATALRGLSVAGASLWEKYDNGDNLLFTEDDYKKPSASKAMQELWRLESPGVQALVGRLAIACGKPIPQTPWLDQFAPDGEPAMLDDATRREAATALGIALPVPVALPPEPKAPVPAPVAPAANPFANIDGLEELPEEEEVDVELVDSPTNRSKKKVPAAEKAQRGSKSHKPVKSGGNGLLLAGAGAAVFLLLAGIVGAVVMSGGAKPKPDETAQQKEEPPVVAPPKAEPKGPNVPLVVPKKDDTPAVLPKKGPDAPPAPATWAVTPGWSQPLPNDWKRAHGLRIGPDSRTGQVYAGDGKFLVFDTATGEVLKNPPDAAGILYGVSVLNDGRVAKTWQVPDGPLQVWNARTGKEDAALARVVDGPVYVEVSPNGRYLAATPGNGQGKVPLKLADTSTGKTLVDLGWVRGSVMFTTDSSRALIADGLGQCRWVKLPSGETDGEWNVGDGVANVGLVALSGDGSRAVVTGGRAGGLLLVDAQTGKVIRTVKTDVGRSGLSHDGKALLLSRHDGARRVAEIADTATGDVLLQVPLPDGVDPTAFGLAPDGSAAFVALPVGADKFALVRYTLTRPGAPSVSPEPGPSGAAFKERYKVPLDFIARVVQFDPEGKVLAAHDFNTRTLLLVDTQTGTPRTVTATSTLHSNDLVPLTGGRIGIWPTRGKTIEALALDTGRPVGSLPMPEISADATPTRIIVVSPDDRYVASAARSVGKLNPDTKKVDFPPVPVRIIDTKTNKNVLEVDWQTGRGAQVAFSEDSSRVLLVDESLRGRWYKLPSGTLDKEWTLGEVNGLSVRIRSATTDGRVLLCDGPIDGKLRPFVIDGATGKRTATFAEAFGVVVGSGLSADGRRALLSHRKQANQHDFALVDTGTGAEIARLGLPVGTESDPTAVLAPDGRSVAVFDRRKVAPLVVYDLVPSGAGGAVAVAQPPAVGGGDDPTEEPTPGEPPALRTRWGNVKVGDGKAFDQLLFAPDASAVLLGSAAGGFEALDPKSGAPRTVGFTLLNTAGITDFFPLTGGHVGTLSPKATEVKVWDGKTGRLVVKRPVPEIAVGSGGATELRAFLAPSEKHIVAARSGPPALTYPDVPFKVFEAGGKKEELATEWKGGDVHFTADSGRVLVAEWNGRCRWFKLPSGEAAESWDLGTGRAGRLHQITSASANGLVLGYTGPAAEKGRSNGSGVLDGKTGKITRAFHRDYQTNSQVSISADGKRAALVRASDNRSTALDVVDLATGARVGRARVTFPFDSDSAAVPLFALAPDGLSLVIYDPVRQKVHLFEVPAPTSKSP